jgi:hypothetical protein
MCLSVQTGTVTIPSFAHSPSNCGILELDLIETTGGGSVAKANWSGSNSSSDPLINFIDATHIQFEINASSAATRTFQLNNQVPTDFFTGVVAGMSGTPLSFTVN